MLQILQDNIDISGNCWETAALCMSASKKNSQLLYQLAQDKACLFTRNLTMSHKRVHNYWRVKTAILEYLFMPIIYTQSGSCSILGEKTDLCSGNTHSAPRKKGI